MWYENVAVSEREFHLRTISPIDWNGPHTLWDCTKKGSGMDIQINPLCSNLSARSNNRNCILLCVHYKLFGPITIIILIISLWFHMLSVGFKSPPDLEPTLIWQYSAISMSWVGETLSALCKGNSPVAGGTVENWYLFAISMNKLLNKRLNCWWFLYHGAHVASL